ncbi:MAG: SDR family oxidoreductase [Chloroflexi bacterium]|nr:SDR family oxidoreductase [Chloroflexota bacterium]
MNNRGTKRHIVLTGATGNTGRVIAKELGRRGVPFVAMARNETSRAQLATQGIETVLGDFYDPPSMVRALEGAKKAYLVCSPDHLLVPRETAFITVAKQAGVRHIVKCSAYLAGVDAETRILRSHGIIERALLDSGLDYTIIRPHGFMQTFTLASWDLLQKVGVITFPGGSGGLPFVDVRDVATVGVKALTEPGHTGKVYDVTGPETLTFYQMAEILERVLGRPVTYLPGSEALFTLILLLMGVTVAPREHLIKIARVIRDHQLEKVHPTLQELGIQPTTYEQFVRDLVAGRTGRRNPFQMPETLAFKMLRAVIPVMMQLRLRLSGRSRH